MTASFKKPAHFLGAMALVALPLALPIAALAADEAESAEFMDHGDHHSSSHEFSPLVAKVHNATAKYRNINFALKKEKAAWLFESSFHCSCPSWQKTKLFSVCAA